MDGGRNVRLRKRFANTRSGTATGTSEPTMAGHRDSSGRIL